MSKKMFDFCIGNPAYQESRDNTKDMPVYDKFMDASEKIASAVELITPARFLFNAGATSKKWNKKKLCDTHFKALSYTPKSSTIFPNTDIKGGVLISYYDKNKEFKPIEVFTPFMELNNILLKIKENVTFESIDKIMYAPSTYKFTSKVFIDFPDIKKALSKGNEKMLVTNIFEKMHNIVLFDAKRKEKDIKILGRYNNQRCFMWINDTYIEKNKNLFEWKVVLPKVSGTGKFGEKLTDPVIENEGSGFTQSFFCIGNLNNLNEAESVEKYIKGKFCRAMLGVLKITQDCPPSKWKYVPLQDFTDHSDIDWSKSIPEIDQQLYRKYGLNEEEINFIETHVKEMK